MISYNEAKEIFIKQFHKDREHGPKMIASELPYNITKNAFFVCVDVDINTITAFARHEELVKKIKIGYNENTSPVWLTYGRDFDDGLFNPFWDYKFQVKDGNHRIQAAKELGHKTIKAYMPEKHYFYYKGTL